MPTCPNGHHNPKNQQLCTVCDALIVPAEKRSWSARTWWVIIASGVVAAAILAVVLVVVLGHGGGRQKSATPATNEIITMQQWWSGAHEHFDKLQNAVDASKKGLENHDEAALRKSCQDMHDAGTVDLRAHLPSPDPDLTTEIEAAVNDAHEAAHMCLAAIDGSQNNYAGEFAANLDQVELHLKAALDIVNKRLLEA